MKVLIYFPGVNRNSGGIFQYTFALLNALSRDDKNNYILYTEPNQDIDILLRATKNFSLVKPISANAVGWSKRMKQVQRLGYKIIKRLVPGFQSQSPFEQLCKVHNIDIVYSPIQSIPNTGLPKIVTLHDVQELHFPEFFSSGERMWRAINYKRSIDKADAVVVSYDHIRKDIIRFFDKPANQVHVILLEMNNLWFEKYIHIHTLMDISQWTENKPYLLYPAATWPHKNHTGLIKAMKILKERGVTIRLLCTGNLTRHFEQIQKLLLELNLSDELKFLGIVSDETLFSLYKNARGIVVPTIYEAGSFPVMEAILMQVPVICSNVTSLPDTIGNSDYIFDPTDYKMMADKMEKLVLSDEFRVANIDNSRKQGERLTKTGALSKINGVFKTITNVSKS